MFITVLFLLWSLNLYAQAIDRVEYFVDSDPGLGNGQFVALNAADSLSLNFSANLNAVAPGVHVLYVRGRSSAGHWSLLRSHPFVVEEVASDSLPAIAQIEYYFVGAEMQTSTVLVDNFNAVAAPDLELNAHLHELSIGASYDLYLGARDERGRLSQLFAHSFLVEENAPALVGDFDGSGAVDFADFFLFGDFFGSDNSACDLDGSGTVDFGDFFLFADFFGRTAGE